MNEHHCHACSAECCCLLSVPSVPVHGSQPAVRTSCLRPALTAPFVAVKWCLKHAAGLPLSPKSAVPRSSGEIAVQGGVAAPGQPAGRDGAGVLRQRQPQRLRARLRAGQEREHRRAAGAPRTARSGQGAATARRLQSWTFHLHCILTCTRQSARPAMSRPMQRLSTMACITHMQNQYAKLERMHSARTALQRSVSRHPLTPRQTVVLSFCRVAASADATRL